MPQPALINGVAYGWSNISFVLYGVPVRRITKIEYKLDMKKENLYGANNKPVMRGYGNIEPSGMIELYMDEWANIIDAAPYNDPLYSPFTDISVVYDGRFVTGRVDILRSVEFLSNPFTVNQGDTSIKCSIPLIIGDIERLQQ